MCQPRLGATLVATVSLLHQQFAKNLTSLSDKPVFQPNRFYYCQMAFEAKIK